MNHPHREQWAAFLYGELPPEGAADLEAHLAVCPDCKANLAEWRATLKQLDTWSLPAPKTRVTWELPTVKWAIAALFLVCTGFAAGRLAVPSGPNATEVAAQVLPVAREQIQRDFRADFAAALSNDPSAINTEFRRQLRSDLETWTRTSAAAASAEAQPLLASLVQDWQTVRTQDQQTMVALFKKYERQLAQLRRDVDTVAFVNEVRSQATANRLGQLASYTPTDTPAGN